MDPFRLCVALGPLAVYCLLLGGVHLTRRPLVVSGLRDMAALGVAVAGLILVGPVEMLLPYASVAIFGPSVWLFLITLYVLGLILVLLMMRPRLVVYNITMEQFRPILAEVVQQLDQEARWAGDGVFLPSLGVQLYLETIPILRNICLEALGHKQNFLGWRRLEQALRSALAENENLTQTPRVWKVGLALLAVGACLLLLLFIRVASDPQAVAQSVLELLHLQH
ncbi:MAG: hypothetical protein NZ602_03050 [Thermoguttaceae bacterium]|nr:hypothetical protein [Thermoguttaceae bacterium]MDW8036864.1 hypothetical protein [Thermoguttaceae bacterium]